MAQPSAGNPHRGEAAVELCGARYVLRLTLQALAEIETALAVDGLAALGARLAGGPLSTRDVIHLAAALIRGGGVAIADDALARRLDAADLPALVAAIAAVFAASFPTESAEQDP